MEQELMKMNPITVLQCRDCWTRFSYIALSHALLSDTSILGSIVQFPSMKNETHESFSQFTGIKVYNYMKAISNNISVEEITSVYISSLLLLWQIPINLLSEIRTNLLSYRSGGQKSTMSFHGLKTQGHIMVTSYWGKFILDF